MRTVERDADLVALAFYTGMSAPSCPATASRYIDHAQPVDVVAAVRTLGSV